MHASAPVFLAPNPRWTMSGRLETTSPIELQTDLGGAYKIRFRACWIARPLLQC